MIINQLSTIDYRLLKKNMEMQSFYLNARLLKAGLLNATETFQNLIAALSKIEGEGKQIINGYFGKPKQPTDCIIMIRLSKSEKRL